MCDWRDDSVVEVLPHKNEDLSSNPHYPWRRLGMVAHTLKPKAEEVVTKGFLGP